MFLEYGVVWKRGESGNIDTVRKTATALVIRLFKAVFDFKDKTRSGLYAVEHKPTFSTQKMTLNYQVCRQASGGIDKIKLLKCSDKKVT
ncbi:hypothetical protein A1359_09275 [Methylomonas lenta]|uniref:Uncharacterized protein n=1 Tax=Methylomonas lenta TaxID=980561 RepID=A0A177NCH0_9GAMM|nr:hypothetical protein A1359_09275 [Methylomonas lenta]